MSGPLCKNCKEHIRELEGTGIESDQAFCYHCLDEEFEKLEARIQNCNKCNQQYLANSHEYPCPYCTPSDREYELEEELKEAIGWVHFVVGEVGTYNTPMVEPAREYLKKLKEK